MQKQSSLTWKETIKNNFYTKCAAVALLAPPVLSVAAGLASSFLPGISLSVTPSYFMTWVSEEQASHIVSVINSLITNPSLRQYIQSVNSSIFAFIGYYLLMPAFIAPILNFLPSYGEERGWRGYLQPRWISIYLFPLLNNRLKRLGYKFWSRSAITGAIHGIWHIPQILSGHNYPFHPISGSLMFVQFVRLHQCSLHRTRIRFPLFICTVLILSIDIVSVFLSVLYSLISLKRQRQDPKH